MISFNIISVEWIKTNLLSNSWLLDNKFNVEPHKNRSIETITYPEFRLPKI